jgi:hypothetical protein
VSISASALPRISRCPASAVLPQVQSTSEEAEWGTVAHAFLADAVTNGRADALPRVPEAHREQCEGLDLSWLNIGQWAAEVAFALNVATGEARELGRDTGRSYRGLLADEVPGTADLVGITGDAIVILDAKTGQAVDAAAKNWQLKFLAVCAARVYGKSKAVVGLVYLRDERAYIDRAELDALDLDDAVGELVDILDRVDVARIKVKAGQVPDVSEGLWCKHCPAFAACPAKRDLALALAGNPPAELQLGMLTPTTAGVAWSKLVEAKQLLGKVEAAVKAAVAEYGEVPLPDGRVLREVATERESIDGEKAWQALANLYDRDMADVFTERSTSKAHIRRVLSEIAKGSGQSLAVLERDAIKAIRKAGGIHTKTTRSVREVKGDSE